MVWTPSEDWVGSTTLGRYQRWLADACGLLLPSYDDLWRWSVAEPDKFWRTIIEFFDVRFGGENDGTVLAERTMPGARWFPGATVSYPEHIFRGFDDRAIAIRHTSESRPELGAWTWGDLRAQTARIAAGLRANGVGQGDRVCAYMPNIPETVASLLACASIGAIWSSAAPEFGSRSVIDRFAQIKPKVLLTIDGYRYGGTEFDRAENVERIAAELGDARVVRFGYLDGCGWPEDFLGPLDAELTFTQVPFDDPLWVLFSSGTSGLPKPIVQSQGGILIEQIKHHHLHLNARAEDRVFWFTTTGWMMWNTVVGVLLTDASIVLFDGNPGYPTLERLWDLAADTGITTFGTSPAFINSCAKVEVSPTANGKRDLHGLRAVGVTGAPLSSEGYQWIYEQLGDDTWLFSTSGGTDVCTAFVGGVPTLPVYPGEIQARALGVDVQAFDPDGQPVIDTVGELVVRQPMPSMPTFFWGDDDGSRLRESYFEMYPGIWRHGDWIEITSRGTAMIYGRSDSTINRGGVRMGTAEIYRVALSVPEVLDSLVIDLPREGTDGWMPLFVVIANGTELTDELIATIRRRIREDCSPRHVPDEVRRVPDVPRTLSGKLLEVPVKRILTGTPPEQAASRDSLANPAALDYFVALTEEYREWRSRSGGAAR